MSDDITDEYGLELTRVPIQCPTLSTKGLILIPATIDIPDYSHWLNDPEVVKFSELRHREWTHEDCKKYIASFDQIKNCMWTINVLGANMHIGNITVHHDPYNNVSQMGMLIGEKWAWGRRYGREAWQAVLTWTKADGVRQVEAGCMNANEGMKKVMSATGMGLANTLNNHFLLNGKPEAKVTYRIAHV
jgi:ribosomal-protein-alanine N-acetyltransferase